MSTSAGAGEECVTVFANIPDTTTANDMAEALIVRGMAASVSIIPEVKTFKASRKYGVKEKPECIMVIKTRKTLENKVTDFITLNCPYKDDKVDVTAVNIENGNPQYLKWVYEKSDFKS
ncbi:unnamed protein product [Plutella xylostella]|uniref:(diamondback moth) hypothetical protein n=1 Tax=Plutella xylostella TaxID=51655 RepID=A0A8S4GAJ8_PLUXY|nr:unnamed protein product [Plutella xylostella]